MLLDSVMAASTKQKQKSTHKTTWSVRVL